MGDPDESRRLRDALRKLMVEHGALDDSARPCGTPLSLPHAHALLELHARGAPMSVSELAGRLRIDRTNVSRLCQRMEADGELLRCTDGEDGRVRLLRLTPQGEAAAARVDRASLAHFSRLARVLGDDLTVVVSVVEQLTDAIARSRALQEAEP